MFSATVMSGMICAALRHVADAEMRALVRLQARSYRLRRARSMPARGGLTPVMLRINVVLPAPLRPSTATSSPSPISSETPMEDVAGAVESVDAADAAASAELSLCRDRRRAPSRSPPPRPAAPRPARWPWCSTVTFSRDLPDDVHVVLDQEHRVVLRDPLNELGGPPLAFLGHAGRRLIQQQQLRIGGDQHAELEPLPLAVRERVGGVIGLVGKLDELEDLPDAVVSSPASPA